MSLVRAPLQGTKRKDGRWQIVVTTTRPDGAKVRKTIIRARLEDAQDEASKLIATSARRATKPHTVQELIDVYKNEFWREGGIEAGTRRQHTPAYTRILKWFTQEDIREIDAPEVARWIRAMESDPSLGGRSVQAYRNVLSVLFGHAEELGWMDGNPAKGRKLRVSAKPAHRPRLSESDFRTVVAKEPDAVLRDLWQFLGETGMRIDGALKLNRTAIVRSLDLWWVIGGEKTDAGRNRQVPLSDDLGNRLADREALLFPFVQTPTRAEAKAGIQSPPRPFKYRHVLDLWTEALSRAEVEYTNPHQLRKLAVSRWIHAGMPDDVVKAWAGHSSIVITKDVYNRLGRDRLMMAASGLEYVSSMAADSGEEEKNPLR
jgi:integrase